MEKLLLINILLNVLVTPFQGQTSQWVNQYKHLYANYDGGTGGKNISVDRWGNCYVAGNYSQNVPHGINLMGSFLIKYNSSGVLVWQKNIDNISLVALKLKDSIDPLIIGNSCKTATFDTITIGSGRSFIAQFCNNGAIQWVKQFIGGNISFGSSDVYGNIFVAGLFQDSMAFGNHSVYNAGYPHSQSAWAFIAKFDTAGACLWAIQSQDHVDNKTFFVDAKGASYLGGDYGQALTFASTTINGAGGPNGFLVKHDSSGQLSWIINIGSNSAQFGAEDIGNVSVDSSGTTYVSGSYDQDLVICNTYLPSNNTYFPKTFSAIFDVNGACLSISQTSNYFIDIINNTIYKRGYANTAGIYDGLYLQAGLYIMKCNSMGNGLWAYQTAPGNIWCNVNGDNNDHLYITGRYNGTVDFGGISSTGNNEMFAAKIDFQNVASVLEMGKKIESLSIYPNPSAGTFTINYSSTEKSDSHLRITNAKGQTVFTENIFKFTGEYTKDIDLSKYARGIYFVEIIANRRRTIRKIVLD